MPECKKYFKLKPGTGLPTSHCHCPYCDYEGNADTFWTPQQLDYARSVAMNEAYDTIIQPTIDSLLKPFKDLERKTRNNNFFKITVKTPVTRNSPYPVRYFSEKTWKPN